MEEKENKKLGELLLEHNYISREQLKRAIFKQRSTHKRLGEILIDLNYLEEEQLIEILKEQLGYTQIRLDKYNLDSELAGYVPENIAERYNLVPFSLEGETLKVAMVDPSNIIAIDTLEVNTDYKVKSFIATSREIKEAQRFIYSTFRAGGAQPHEGINDEARSIEVDHPIPQLAHQIVDTAVKKRASDIHIEPEEKQIRIRYRINGILQEQMTLSRKIMDNLNSRFKIMAGMDVTKKRIPQNGRMKIKINNYEVNARVTSLPTLHGEKIVIRLLLKDENLLNIYNLGYSSSNLKKLKQLIEKPYGIILVTGPSSSGKSTTLFACLNYIKQPGINIVTIEDPVEYQLTGIYQVPINTNPNLELDFPHALRSVLRQDPDIIMIGEIRDKETAEIAIRAAITGHLVMSTIHTNDASSAVGRLRSLGVPSYLIQSTLRGVIAQRLVRTLCECKEEYVPDEEEKKFLKVPMVEEVKFYSPRGCLQCGNTGYIDRTTIEEVLFFDDDFEQLIINEAGKKEIERLASGKGFTTMKDNAREKVIQGITSYPEIKRVIL